MQLRVLASKRNMKMNRCYDRTYKYMNQFPYDLVGNQFHFFVSGLLVTFAKFQSLL